MRVRRRKWRTTAIKRSGCSGTFKRWFGLHGESCHVRVMLVATNRHASKWSQTIRIGWYSSKGVDTFGWRSRFGNWCKIPWTSAIWRVRFPFHFNIKKQISSFNYVLSHYSINNQLLINFVQNQSLALMTLYNFINLLIRKLRFIYIWMDGY